MQISSKGDGPKEDKCGLNQIANLNQTPFPFPSGQTFDTINPSFMVVHQASTGNSVLFNLQMVNQGLSLCLF